jgi:hypothetical protein
MRWFNPTCAAQRSRTMGDRMKFVPIVVLAACTPGPSQPAPAHPASSSPVATGDPEPGDSETPITPDQPMPAASYSQVVTAALGAPVKALVDGRSDIFSAGLATADGQRHGVLPALVKLPSDHALVVTFSRVVGKVGCGNGAAQSGPEGGGCGGGSTDIESASGISGIVDHGSTQFLVGVFLAGPPSGSGPTRLDFSSGAQTHAFSTLRPQLAQAFYVGNGKSGGQQQQFFVPAGATVLALGIADGYSFNGAPGYYDDNTGGFAATLAVAAIK